MSERLSELLREAAPESEPVRLQDVARRVRRTRRTRVGLAAVLVSAATAGVVVPLAVSTNVGHTARVTVAEGLTPPPTTTVDGRAIPYVGTVPWADAVIATAQSTTVTIFADGDRVGGDACGLPTERVQVRQNADSVVVLVAGYAQPLPPGVGCAGVGHLPQLQPIRLTAPLGTRRLIDASTQVAHAVLDASGVPTLTGLPAGYVPQPVQWDEKTGEVNRTWATTPPTSSTSASYITLTRAPAGVIESDDGPHTPGLNPDGPNGSLVASGVPVANGTARARVWAYDDLHNHMVTMRWTDADGLGHQLVTDTPPGGSLGVAQAEALARSVH